MCNGLPCEDINTVISDDVGSMWLYTECGIVQRLNWEPMTKQQLIDAVANASGRPKPEVLAVVESLLDEIGIALRSGERVDLRGFGSFIVKDKAARKGRNPKTGEPIKIAARKSATFKPSKELGESLRT